MEVTFQKFKLICKEKIIEKNINKKYTQTCFGKHVNEMFICYTDGRNDVEEQNESIKICNIRALRSEGAQRV